MPTSACARLSMCPAERVSLGTHSKGNASPLFNLDTGLGALAPGQGER